MKQRKISIGLSGLAASLALFSNSWTLANFEISSINPPGGLSDTEFTSINNAGEISGYTIDWGVKSSAFVYQNGKFSVLTPSGGYYGFVIFDLNNTGDGIGWTAALHDDPHPVFWNQSSVKQLAPGISGNLNTFAYGLNDSDTVVGSTVDPTSLVQYPLEWNSTGMHRLPTLGGAVNTAQAINDLGSVVGLSSTSGGVDRAVEWIGGKIHTLASLGGKFASASDINQGGVIAGTSTTHSGANHAVMWNKGTVTDLGPAGDVFAINDHSQIVGDYDNDAMIWENGQRIDLNSQLPENSGWHLEYARDINDSGQIIGRGDYDGQTRGFLLTPTAAGGVSANAIPLPDPGTAGLLASPLVIFAMRRSLRKQAAC